MGGWGRRFRLAIKGHDARRNRSFIWHMFHARPGGGASAGGEGWSSIGEWHSAGGIKFGSIEVDEARFPLLFRKHEFRLGSGGEGRFRGGMGVELELEVEAEGLINTAGDGVRHGAAGMLGGEDGLPHSYRILRADGSSRGAQDQGGRDRDRPGRPDRRALRRRRRLGQTGTGRKGGRPDDTELQDRHRRRGHLH